MAQRRVCAAALVLAVAAAKRRGPPVARGGGESYCHPSRAGLSCQGLGPDKRCWIRESCKPDPSAGVTKTLTRTLTSAVATDEHTPAESATCYGRRYPDLTYNFCENGCEVRRLHEHFQKYGRAEGRSFGCDAPPLTETEWNKFEAAAARESSRYAGPGGADGAAAGNSCGMAFALDRLV